MVVNGGRKPLASRRYYALVDDSGDWPPELQAYNARFAETLHKVKRRHDGVVTTMLLRPKVVLDTIVYELGLVDEEDASPSTAEPSASA